MEHYNIRIYCFSFTVDECPQILIDGDPWNVKPEVQDFSKPSEGTSSCPSVALMFTAAAAICLL